MPAADRLGGGSGFHRQCCFQAWMLYALLFLWQLPHFMAIAWIYRDDYARAGYLIFPTKNEGTFVAGVTSTRIVRPLHCGPWYSPVAEQRRHFSMTLERSSPRLWPFVLRPAGKVSFQSRIAARHSTEGHHRLSAAMLFLDIRACKELTIPRARKPGTS